MQPEKINYGKISEKLSKKCDISYPGFFKRKARNICKRSILAAFQLTAVMNKIERKILKKKKYKSISMNFMDKKVVDKSIIRSYPEPQCRFDTFVMGALCPNPPKSFMANSTRDNQCPDKRFQRPRCWFKP